METLISQLDMEIAATENKLNALKQAKAALGGNGAGPVAAPEKQRQRAPAGSLRNVTLAVTKIGEAYAPREINAAIKASGYHYPIHQENISKLLSVLCSEKVFQRNQEGKYLRKK